MKTFSLLLATLSLAIGAPIEVAGQDAVASESNAAPVSLEPLVYASPDGKLWLGPDAKERLLGTNVQEIAARHNFAKRSEGGLQTTEHFCLGGGHHRRPPVRDPCCERPAPPPPPCYEPCDPCYDSCCDPCCDPCCDDNCREELKASCYTKFFCPSTYCCDDDPCCNDAWRSRHPIVDGLRRSCLTKWACPSTYCPSNWCCCEGPECYDGCAPCGPPPCELPESTWCEPSCWEPEPCTPPAPPPCEPFVPPCDPCAF